MTTAALMPDAEYALLQSDYSAWVAYSAPRYLDSWLAIGTTPQAIYQWPDGKPIPEGRQWQLRALYPALFPTDELPKQEAA